MAWQQTYIRYAICKANYCIYSNFLVLTFNFDFDWSDASKTGFTATSSQWSVADHHGTHSGVFTQSYLILLCAHFACISCMPGLGQHCLICARRASSDCMSCAYIQSVVSLVSPCLVNLCEFFSERKERRKKGNGSTRKKVLTSGMIVSWGYRTSSVIFKIVPHSIVRHWNSIWVNFFIL